ncbi:MAG: hypothetical protein Q8918_14430 [Bacteroidota bacterium]|nr:hypothetical protein [Bacteroidota bacterium]MDP4251299.1 hypothetical protein [Bacteroidota bacterium]
MIKGIAGAGLSRFLDRKSISLVCLILFSLLLTSKIDAQAPAATFTLKGEINTDSGGVELMPVCNSSYYPASLHSFETTIVNGRFQFSDSIEYPYGFRLGVKLKDQWIYLSDYFVVDPREQSVICNIDSLREMSVLRNKSMQDLRKAINSGPVHKKASRFLCRIVVPDQAIYVVGLR